jgi:hypothetical protein
MKLNYGNDRRASSPRRIPLARDISCFGIAHEVSATAGGARSTPLKFHFGFHFGNCQRRQATLRWRWDARRFESTTPNQKTAQTIRSVGRAYGMFLLSPYVDDWTPGIDTHVLIDDFETNVT